MLNQKIEDNIIIATFEHGKFNSITKETVTQLEGIIKKVNEDDSIKGLIITGAGKIFSSGFDLTMFLGFKELGEAVAFFEKSEKVFMDFFTCSKPVVSAINGAAMAGGLILAMACDYRICKSHPKIQLGMSEIKLGLGLSVVQTEIMRFGLDSDKKFRDVMYTGERYSVEKALEMGIVDEVAADDTALMARAKEVVAGWIDNPGRAFMQLKKGLRMPARDRMQKYLEETDWRNGFKALFNPQTRAALDMVNKMMQG